MSFFNLSTEKNTGKPAEEGVEYITVTGPHGSKYTVINIDHPMYGPTEGMVTFAPLRFSKGVGDVARNHNRPSFGAVPDKKTGWILGIPTRPNAKGEMQFKRISINGEAIYNMAIPAERAEAICIMNGPFVKGSPNFQTHSKTVYEVVNKDKDDALFFKNLKVKRRAAVLADALVGEELEDIALMLGADPKLMSPMSLSRWVVEFAENPNKVNGKTGAERFMEVYESESRTQLTVYKRGLSTGILQETPNGIHYNGLVIGFNEAEALKYLREHPATMASIDLTARKKQEDGVNATKPRIQIETKVDEDISVLKARLAKAERELADKSQQLKETTEVALDSRSELHLKEKDEEFAELLKEAKRLNIKGAHLVKDKEKLRAKIAEAQKQTNN